MKPHHDYIKIWVATLETRSFSFSAYHTTEREAMFAIEQALKVHGEQYQLDPDWWTIYLDAIHIREVLLGHAYRDTSEEPIFTP